MRIYAALLALCLCVPLAASDAQVHGYADGRHLRHPQRLDQILPAIRHRHPGNFYDAEGPFEGPDGRLHYRLKWLTPDGRVIWLDADAETGAELGMAIGPGGPGYERRGDERRYDPRYDHPEERRNEGHDYRHDDRRDDRHGERHDDRRDDRHGERPH